MLEELKQSSQKTPKPADKMKKPQQKDQESGDKKKKPHQKDQESGDKKKKPHQKDQESGAKEAPLQISILGFDMSEELDVEKFVHGFTRSQLGMYKLNMEEAGSKWTQYCRDNLSRPCEFDEWTRLQRISKNFGTCITIYNQAVGHNALEERSPLGLAEVNLNSNADADIFLASLKKNSPEAWNAYKEEVMRQVESIDEDRTQLPEKSLGNLIRSTMRWNYLQIQSAIARMEQRQEEALKPGPKANQPEETRLWSFGADLRQPVFATFHKEWLQQMEPEELVKYKKELAEKHSAIRAASREMKLNEDDALVLANCEECFKMIADIEGSRREDELPPAPKSEAPKDEEPEGEAFARLMKGSQEKKAAEEALLKEQAAKKPEAEEEDATLKFLSSQIVKSQPLGLSAETLELPAPLLLPPPPAVLQLQLPGTQGGQQNPDLTESQPGTPKDTSPQHSPRRDHKAPDERDAKMPPRLLSSASSADDSDSN
jgi:Ni/Co efflux regulator RcnB